MRIPLMTPTYGQEEITEVLDSLNSGKVTMGEKVTRFEEQFAKYIGVKHGVMVNSGSTANLIAMTLLGLEPGSEVITPAVTWPTTIYPIVQVQSVPVLVDIQLPELTLSPNYARRAITKKTKCLLPVHLLGNPCEMDELMEMRNDHHLPLVEDCCEAHGTEINGRKVGSFGDLSTFSFFFSHIINSIEGGMVLTNDEDYANEAQSLRAHGWIRGRTDKHILSNKYRNIDPRFLFVSLGYSVRPTELQACFGLHQLPKLEGFIRDRQRNMDYWNRRLPEKHLILPKSRNGVRRAWFAYPIGVKKPAPFTKNQLVEHLEKNGIETRPIVSGNMARQPVMETCSYRTPFPLTNSDLVDEDWFLIGNHSGIGEHEREYVTETILQFIHEAES